MISLILATLAAVLFAIGYFVEKNRNKEEKENSDMIYKTSERLRDELEKKTIEFNNKILDLKLLNTKYTDVTKKLEEEKIISKALDNMLGNHRSTISTLNDELEKSLEDNVLLESQSSKNVEEINKLKQLLNQDRELIVTLEDENKNLKKNLAKKVIDEIAVVEKVLKEKTKKGTKKKGTKTKPIEKQLKDFNKKSTLLKRPIKSKKTMLRK